MARIITNVLLGIIVLVMFGWLWTVYKAKKQIREEQKEARLRIEVEPLYQEFLAKNREIRERHDPEHKWREFGDSDDRPQVYRDEQAALTEAYKGVLILKFGAHIVRK